jgi:hypothetical protein
VTYLQRIGPVLLVAGALCVGCNKDDSAIRSYSAPKDDPSQTPAVAMDTGQAAAPPEAQPNGPAPIQWTLPSDWKQTGGAGDMRYATIQVQQDPKAELTVVPLGPESAALMPNLIRWAGQLRIPAPTEADISKLVTQTQVSGEQAQLIEMTGAAEVGTPPPALLAAIIPHAGQVWFFTLKAPQPVVAAQKPEFGKFIHSIQFPTEQSAPAAAQALSRHGQMANPAATGSYRLESWKTPDGWVEQPGSNSMRVTSFRVTGNGQQAEAIVSRIQQGHSGSLVDNYNRWRGQVGLGPIREKGEAHSTSGNVAGLPAMFVTFVGPKTDEAPKQVMVAMTIVGGDDWFIKLIGPESLVSTQQNEFKQFVESLKFTPEQK